MNNKTTAALWWESLTDEDVGPHVVAVVEGDERQVEAVVEQESQAEQGDERRRQLQLGTQHPAAYTTVTT